MCVYVKCFKKLKPEKPKKVKLLPAADPTNPAPRELEAGALPRVLLSLLPLCLGYTVSSGPVRVTDRGFYATVLAPFLFQALSSHTPPATSPAHSGADVCRVNDGRTKDL